MENKIERETAEDEFDRWVEAMRIEMDPEGLDENDRNDNTRNKFIVLKQIEKGFITICEEGQLHFEPEGGGGPFTFREPNGDALAKTDMKKPNANDAKTNAVLGTLARTSPIHFGSKLKWADKKVCMAVMNLFLA